MTTCDHFITTSPKTRDQLKYFEKCRVNQGSDKSAITIKAEVTSGEKISGKIVAFFSLDPLMTHINTSFVLMEHKCNIIKK